MSSNHLIGLGGTGVKTVEAFVHLTAAGLMPGDVEVSLFDQDRANGNLVTTKGLLETYRNLHENLGTQLSVPFLRTEIKRPAMAMEWMWSPLQISNTSMSQFFALPTLNSDLQDFVRCLYQPGRLELDMDLGLGFRGRPAVGAAVISGSTDRGHVLWDYIKGLVGSKSDDVNIFLAGSVFGGTGAAGLPGIARQCRKIIADNTSPNPGAPSNYSIGACLMLPYFTFSDQSCERENGELPVMARSADQVLRSQLALEFYANSMAGPTSDRAFDTIYLVGLDPEIPLEYCQLGGNDQRNPALLPELVGALSMVHFFDRGKGLRGQVLRCGRQDKESVTWNDLPSPSGIAGSGEVLHALGQLLRFAFAYYYVYHGYMTRSRRKVSREPWYRRLINAEGVSLAASVDASSLAVCETLHNYCGDLLAWFTCLTTNTRKELSLSALGDVSGFGRCERLSAGTDGRRDGPPIPHLNERPKTVAERRVLTDAFDRLLGNVHGPGLDVIYEGLCRQSAPRSPGIPAFIDALWKACALSPR